MIENNQIKPSSTEYFGGFIDLLRGGGWDIGLVGLIVHSNI